MERKLTFKERENIRAAVRKVLRAPHSSKKEKTKRGSALSQK